MTEMLNDRTISERCSENQALAAAQRPKHQSAGFSLITEKSAKGSRTMLAAGSLSHSFPHRERG